MSVIRAFALLSNLQYSEPEFSSFLGMAGYCRDLRLPALLGNKPNRAVRSFFVAPTKNRVVRAQEFFVTLAWIELTRKNLSMTQFQVACKIHRRFQKSLDDRPGHVSAVFAF